MWQHSLLSQFELILSVTLYSTLSNAFLIAARFLSVDSTSSTFLVGIQIEKLSILPSILVL